MICVLLVRKVLPRNCGGSLSFGNGGLLDSLGTSRKIVKTIALYQFSHHCNFGKVTFPAGGVSTNVTVSSEKSKHFYVKLFGDVIAGRWIPKFTCLRECRLTCQCLGIKEI